MQDTNEKRVRYLQDKVDHLTQQKKRLLKEIRELRTYIRRHLAK